MPLDDPDCGSFSTGPNLWPSSLPKEKFQDRIMAYQKRMLKLVETILGILAQGLPKDWGCPPDVFNSLLNQPSIPMRFLHYGPVEVQHELQFGGESLSSQYNSSNAEASSQLPIIPTSAASPSCSKRPARPDSRSSTRRLRPGCPCPWSRKASSSTWAT